MHCSDQFMEHTDALCTHCNQRRESVWTQVPQNAILCSKTFSSALSVQPMGAVGAACYGWLPGGGRFPPIGGRPGNTAATTLPPAAADSRLTSFSQEQSSLPFQTWNNLNQDERGSGRKKAENQWIWPLQSKNQHGGR